MVGSVIPEVQMATLALFLLGRLVDTVITLARKDPDWKPEPMPTNFEDLVAAGRALKAAESGGLPGEGA
jgi:hypothetical protein